jgi:hypothetical protein
MICYVALDIGNVLCRVDFRKFTFAISKHLNISTWEAGHRMNLSQKFRDVGLLTMTEVLESEFNIKTSIILDDLLNIWNNEVVTFDNNMLDFFTFISSDNDLNIALLSNVGTDHAEMIDNYINKIYLRYSDHYSNLAFKKAIRHYSCNVGVRKPQSLYYQSFLLEHPEFKGCVYLDDISENIKASIQFGFNAIEFDLEKPENMENKLRTISELILAPKDEKNSRWH